MAEAPSWRAGSRWISTGSSGSGTSCRKTRLRLPDMEPHTFRGKGGLHRLRGLSRGPRDGLGEAALHRERHGQGLPGAARGHPMPLRRAPMVVGMSRLRAARGEAPPSARCDDLRGQEGLPAGLPEPTRGADRPDKGKNLRATESVATPRAMYRDPPGQCTETPPGNVQRPDF